MKKRVSAILLALVLILCLVAACSDKSAPVVGAAARGVYIAIDYMSGSSLRFDRDEFQRLMGDYNIELTVEIGNVADNISAIEQAIEDSLDVIFINPNDIESVIPALTRAREAGIIVGLFSSHPPLDEYPDYPFDFFAGTDDYLGGVQAGEYVSERFPDGANFVEVGGQTGHIAAINRHEGFRDGIAANIVELDSQFVPGSWRTDEAREIMEDFLLIYGDEINIVWCHWDNGASGVIEAVQNAGKVPGTDIAAGEIFIIGYDGNGTGYKQVEDGFQALSVGQSLTNMAMRCLENARIMLDGGTVDKMNWIPHDMVTLETIDNFPRPEW